MSDTNGSTTRLEQMMLKMAETVSRLEAENAAMRAQIGSNDVMAQQLRNEAAYKREAWRSEFDNHQTFYAEVKANMEEATARGEDPWGAIKKEFADQARQKLLGPLDVLILTYLIFGTPESQYKLSCAWLEATSPQQKVSAHNWLVLAGLGEHRKRQLGPHISKMTWPLFPEEMGPEFSSLNHGFLRDAGATQRLFGRGAVEEELRRPEALADDGFGKLFGTTTPSHTDRVVYGAGGYMVKVSADGFVDLSDADAAMVEHQNRTTALEMALRNAGIEIPVFHSTRQSQTNRNRGGRGAAGSRGGSRGGRGNH